MNVAEALRLTPKGQLKYERNGFIGFEEELLELKRRQNSLAFGLHSNGVSTEVICNKAAQDTSEDVDESSSRNHSNGAELLLQDVEQFEVTEERRWDIMIMNYEEDLSKKAEEAIAKKTLDFLEHQTQLIEDKKRQIKALEEKRNKEREHQREEYLAQLQARNDELVLLQQNQRQRLDYSIQLINAKIKEAERTQKQIEAETEERLLLKKQQENLAATIHQCQKDINLKYLTMVEALRSCSDPSSLPESIKEDIAKNKEVTIVFNRLLNAAKSSCLTLEDATAAVNLVRDFNSCIKNILESIEKVNKAQQSLKPLEVSQAENEENKYPVQNISKPSISPASVQKTNPEAEKLSVQIPTSVDKNSEVSAKYIENSDFTSFVSPKALTEYVKLQTFLKTQQNSYQQLQNGSNSNMKKYRFDLQKAVNIPVNAISPLSGQHVKDKLERLKKLLSGHPVDISNSRVSASEHPMAIALCKDLLAKKIVKQGEEQVAAKYVAAFAIAATVIGLWVDFPDFGDLLLAHFHQKCPFIVPFYVPRVEGQTEEEHYKAMGYIYIDGTIEKQDKYLKRMSGIMRLYSAILCTQVPHGYNHPHPHGIQYGWQWMSRILNLEPKVDITATLLYDFLETAGFAMQAAYKNQFEKLMSALCRDFFPKIKKVSVGGTGGPITRLENFLVNYTNSRRISRPEGLLSQNFWFT